MAFIENAKEIFLEALEYPHYARAEFYLKKQKESGWSKASFLSSLKGAYHHYDDPLTMKRHRERKINPDLKDEDIGNLLEKRNKGKGKRSLFGIQQIFQAA